MGSFAYTAINAQGMETEGVISAGDLLAAREQLRVRGLLAQSISEVGTGPTVGQTSISFGKAVKAKSLQIFSRQFATMIEAGPHVVGAPVLPQGETDEQAPPPRISGARQEG